MDGSTLFLQGWKRRLRLRAVVMGAHSVGAPHLRRRLYWGGVLGYAERQRTAGSLRGEPDETGAVATPNIGRLLLPVI